MIKHSVGVEQNKILFVDDEPDIQAVEKHTFACTRYRNIGDKEAYQLWKDDA